MCARVCLASQVNCACGIVWCMYARQSCLAELGLKAKQHTRGHDHNADMSLHPSQSSQGRMPYHSRGGVGASGPPSGPGPGPGVHASPAVLHMQPHQTHHGHHAGSIAYNSHGGAHAGSAYSGPHAYAPPPPRSSGGLQPAYPQPNAGAGSGPPYANNQGGGGGGGGSQSRMPSRPPSMSYPSQTLMHSPHSHGYASTDA